MTRNQEERGVVQMALNEEVTMLSSKGGYQETWKDVFQANLDALFQLALLLTAGPQEAEANLATVMSTLDFSKQPDEDALAVIQAALARQSIGSGGIISSAGVAGARSMLQPGLLPVLQLERFPRVCFVLRMLFGYATSACAGMLGIDEGGVKVLLRVAVLQLHHARSMHIAETKEGPGGVMPANPRSAPPPAQNPIQTVSRREEIHWLILLTHEARG
jgi:hypothetical protein